MTSNKMTASCLPGIAQALEQQILNINKNWMMTLVQHRKGWNPLTPEKEEELRMAADSQKKEVAQVMSQHLRCPICQDFFIQPTSLNCSHVYCRLCVNTWRRTSPSCPTCRRDVTSCKSMVRLGNCMKRIFQELGGEFLQHRTLAMDQRCKNALAFDEDRPQDLALNVHNAVERIVADGDRPQYLALNVHNAVDRIVADGDRPQDLALNVHNAVDRIVADGDRPQDLALNVHNAVDRIAADGDRPQNLALNVHNAVDRIVADGDRPQDLALNVHNAVDRLVADGDRPQDLALNVHNAMDRIVADGDRPQDLALNVHNAVGTLSLGRLVSVGASVCYGGARVLSSVGSLPKKAIKSTKSVLKTAKTGLAAHVLTLTNRVAALMQSGANPSDMLRKAASVVKEASLSGYAKFSKSKFLKLATELGNWAALQQSAHLTKTQLKQKASAMAKSILKAGTDTLSSAKAMKSSLVKKVKSVKKSVAKRARAATAKTAHALARSVTSVKDSVLRKAAACQRAVRYVQSNTKRALNQAVKKVERQAWLGDAMLDLILTMLTGYREIV